MQIRHAARIAAIAVAGLAYVAGSHWLMVQTQASTWNVVGVLTPMLLVIAIGAWRGGQRLVGAGAGLAIAALCLLAQLGVQVSSHALYLLQHVGINLFLAIVFGSTLRAGATPLITTLALRVHGGQLASGQLTYTRRLTWAWVLFFMAIVLVSLALYGWAGFESWAVFANLVTPAAIGVMLVGEHSLRFRLHPEFKRSSLGDAIRAYMHGSKASAQAPQGHSAS